MKIHRVIEDPRLDDRLDTQERIHADYRGEVRMIREKRSKLRLHDPHDKCRWVRLSQLRYHWLTGNDVADMLDQKDATKRTTRVCGFHSCKVVDDCPGLLLHRPYRPLFLPLQRSLAQHIDPPAYGVAAPLNERRRTQ